MESKQTSVEWLLANIDWQLLKYSTTHYDMIVEQAKEMHKQEIIDAYRDGRSDQQSDDGRFYNRNANYYYNETYNK